LDLRLQKSERRIDLFKNLQRSNIYFSILRYSDTYLGHSLTKQRSAEIDDEQIWNRFDVTRDIRAESYRWCDNVMKTRVRARLSNYDVFIDEIIWSKSSQRSKDELSTNVLVLKHESLRESNLTAEKAAGVIHPVNKLALLITICNCPMQRFFTSIILHNALILVASCNFLA